MDKPSDEILDKEADAGVQDGTSVPKSAEPSEDSGQSVEENALEISGRNGNDCTVQQAGLSDCCLPEAEAEKAEKKDSYQEPPGTSASANSTATPSARLKDPDERQFEENVKYLYRSHQREPGKRRVKPNLQLLEMDLNLPEEDSEDDSDYKVDGDEDQGDDDEDDDDEATDDDDEAGDGENSATKDDDDDVAKSKELSNDRANSESENMNGLLSAIEKAKQLSDAGLTNGLLKVNVCNICLGDMSGETDEIVECDHCGVTVHEGCYGVSDADSVLSTGSSSSTEPWFCDSCKAGVVKPRCELCPNMGGIFKETDAGRWVHLVCALYTPGCAFGSTEKLTPVTLFEMQYSKWGAKPCHLCEDPLMARTGVAINCDAGMCRISFHVTCAQRQGLLSDANPEYIADPFYAHCKVHVDKMKMKTKKRNWALLQYQVRIRREKEQREESEGQEISKEKERILRKLNWLRERYAIKKENNTKVWLPTQKMPRFMPSSATAIEKYRKKAELYGLSHLLVAPPEDRRWHTQVSFSVDFVSYFLDRQRRVKELEKSLEKFIEENTMLRRQQAIMSELYEKVSGVCKAERAHNRHMIEVLTKLWAPLRLLGVKYESQMLREHAEQEGFSSPQKMMKSCKVCSSVEEPHQQIECEQCRATLHLYCLNPPLTRFPKKSKGINWLCEDCLEANKTAQESKKVLPSARRSRQQSSRMARATSEESVSRTPRGKAKKKVARKSTAKSKEKPNKEEPKETTDPETEDDATPVTGSTTTPTTPTTPTTTPTAATTTTTTTTSTTTTTTTTTTTAATASTTAAATAATTAATTTTAAAAAASISSSSETVGEARVEEATPEKEKPSVERSPADKAAKSCKGRKKRKAPLKAASCASKKRRSIAQTTSDDADSSAVQDSAEIQEQIGTENEQAVEPLAQKQKNLDESESMEVSSKNDDEQPSKRDNTKKDKESDTPVKPDRKESVADSSGKKHCVKCDSPDTNQIVICDECNRAIHWLCLEPPVKKNPKPRGYTWTCEECENKDSKAESSTSKSEAADSQAEMKEEQHKG